MEFTADNLEHAVSQFYHTDANMQAQAHQWLTTAQNSQQAWAFVWELLQPYRSAEVQFFAATTLHMKIMKNWSEVPPEQYDALKKQLLQAVVSYAVGPKIVLNRLCIALSAYILQTCPSHWPAAIPELLSMFQPSNLPSIPPDKTVWILLEVLTVIPEEFQSMHLSQTHKVSAKLELERSTPQVVSLVESVLGQDDSGSQLVSQAVRCISTWIQLGIPITDCEQLIDQLVSTTVTSFYSNTEIVESAIEALSHIATHPNSHKYPSCVLSFLTRILPVHHLIRPDLDSIEAQELRASVYGLFISLAESHPRLILNSLLSATSQNTVCLIQIILACSNAPGSYPHQESHSHLAFGFWYILQDELLSCDASQYQLLLSILAPVYHSLALVLIRKSEFPADDQNISAEDKEAFRCYRQDIADTLMYCYNVLRENLLDLLLEKLQSTIQAVTAGENRGSWQSLEACLHGFAAIAETVGATESLRLQMFFYLLHTLPFDKLNIRVAVTALDAIGAYAEWFNSHPKSLTHVIPLLTLGLENAETAPAATLSLKDLSRECQFSIQPYSQLILSASMEALRAGRLKQNECVRLMYTIGRVLSVLPLETIIHYLDTIMFPCVNELHTLLGQEPSATVKAGLLLRLKMLSMIFNTLDTQVAVEENHDVSTVSTDQPVYLVLEKVLPLLADIVKKWRTDSSIIQAVFCAIKHAVSTLLENCTPLVPVILDLVASSYRAHPYPAVLDLAKQLCLLFGQENTTHYPLVCSVLAVIVQTSLVLPLKENTDIVEGFMLLCSQLIKKNPKLLTNTEGIHIVEVFKFATAAQAMAEVPTVKAAASFLSNFISLSREQPALLSAVQTEGEELVSVMLRCIGGESPRACVEPLAEVLLMLNKKYCDNLSRWLQQLLSVDGFPSPKATNDKKQHFAKMVLKERANKRKLQETIREFAFICRGLIGTEYAAQINSLYF